MSGLLLLFALFVGAVIGYVATLVYYFTEHPKPLPKPFAKIDTSAYPDSIVALDTQRHYGSHNGHDWYPNPKRPYIGPDGKWVESTTEEGNLK